MPIKTSSRETVLTGVTTTGTPHLGNYAGAIRPAIDASHRDDSNTFYFLADYHARDHRAQVTLGFDGDLRITALRVDDLANLGAYPTPFGIPIATTTGNRVVNGFYDIPVVDLTVKTVLTNTVPTAPYRGAGRPEVVHRLECAIDMAAAEFGIDPDSSPPRLC